MVDPFRITKFDRTEDELEEFALFCVSVAGKSAETTARALDKYLGTLPLIKGNWPFSRIRFSLGSEKQLAQQLKRCGFGCFNSRATSFKALVTSGLDLVRCSREELEKLHGWGPKTSRFFLLHSRPDFRGAPLDTHVLKFLRVCGVKNVPKSTPPKGKRYLELEAQYMALCPPWQTLADFDLEVWTRHARPPRH